MAESESTKMNRFQVYLNDDDADLLKWLAQHFKPESESSLLRRCIVTNTNLTDLSSEVFKRNNARKNCPIPKTSE